MSQDRFWNENADSLCMDWGTSGLLYVLDAQQEMAKKFLNMVCRIIKRCNFIPCYERCGHDNWLLYPMDSSGKDELATDEIDRIKYTTIGCVEERNCHYLLDADFIYTELLKDCTRGHTIPPKEAYFSELYRIGVISPHSRSVRDIVCKMALDERGAKWYCCIPCFLVKVDLFALPGC